MTKPVTIPNTFATATTAIPLSSLDADFSTVATALNDANTYSNYAPDTGSANAYVVTLSGVSTTYSAGLRIQFKAGNANTTASTLNVNGGGAKNITYQDATAIASGTIAANSIVDVMYDGTQFLLMNDPAGATGGDVVGPSSATDNAIVRFDGTTGKLVQNSVVTIADSTGDISGVGQLNATTLDATNIEVTNIKAKDGTAAASIADSTGVVSITANPVLSGGTANGVLYLNGSKVATSGSALTFDGSTFAVTNASASLALSATKSADGNTAFFRRVGGTYNPGMYISLSDTVNNEIIFNTAYSSGNAPAYVWQQAGTEQMRLTSTGLGIGTSSPGAKLDVVGSIRAQGSAATTFNSFISVGTTTAANYGAITNTGNTLLWGVDSSAGGAVTGGAAYSAWIGSNAAYPFHLLTGGIVKATLDSSGNLGLGVTPSAGKVGTYTKNFEIGGVGNTIRGDGSSTIIVAANAYYDATDSRWEYAWTNLATNYTQQDGIHKWFTAPSGTVGNAITFTQAMTLDASGRFLIGTTTAGIGANANTLLTVGGTNATTYQSIKASGGEELILLVGAGETAIGTYSNNYLSFRTNNTERARITSGGEVYIAGTTDQGAYNLQVNGTGVWGAGAYVNGSDERLKDNIQTLNDGLAVVSQLRPVTFQYKPEHSKDQSVQPGFIAQELQQTMAGKDYVDGVVKSGPEYLNVAYQNLIPILTKAIQEQQALITDLTARVAALEGN